MGTKWRKTDDGRIMTEEDYLKDKAASEFLSGAAESASEFSWLTIPAGIIVAVAVFIFSYSKSSEGWFQPLIGAAIGGLLTYFFLMYLIFAMLLGAIIYGVYYLIKITGGFG